MVLLYLRSCGFVQGRGCEDAIFTLKNALCLRREHELQSHVLFVDLVKAFDSIPRNALLLVLELAGFPPRLLNFIKCMYRTSTIHFTLGNETRRVQCSSGVIQGDPMSPLLFNIFMQYCMESFSQFLEMDNRMFFLTKNDNIVHGRKHKTRGGTPFQVLRSLFADDAAFIVDTYQDLTMLSRTLFIHFERYGLKMHIGRGQKGKSKTVAMFFPCRTMPSFPTQARFKVLGGWIEYVQEFKYLGSMITSDLSDYLEISHRIRMTRIAFKKGERLFCERKLPLKIRANAFKVLVLNIMLYGCKNWILTRDIVQSLRVCFNICVRKLCNVSRWRMVDEHIHQSHLEKKAGLAPFDYYLDKQRLLFAGKIARMKLDRVPRKLLTAWIARKRYQGGAKLRWGHSIQRSFDRLRPGIVTFFKDCAADNRLNSQVLVEVGLLSEKFDWIHYASSVSAKVWRHFIENSLFLFYDKHFIRASSRTA